jgi:hypothetical protein
MHPEGVFPRANSFLRFFGRADAMSLKARTLRFQISFDKVLQNEGKKAKQFPIAVSLALMATVTTKN